MSSSVSSGSKKSNADVLNAQVKSPHQLPGHNVSAFYRTLRDFDGKACTDNAVRNEILLAKFIEGLAICVVRWKIPKAKPLMVDCALSLALEMKSYLNLYGQQPDTSVLSVNNLTGTLTSHGEFSSNIIFNIKKKADEMLLKEVVRRNQTGVFNNYKPTSSQKLNVLLAVSCNFGVQQPHESRPALQLETNLKKVSSRGSTPSRYKLYDSKN